MLRTSGKKRLFFGLLASLSLLTTAAGTATFARLLWVNGGGVSDVLMVTVFAMLFLLVAAGFWTATFGFVYRILGVPAPTAAPPPQEPLGTGRTLPRTAILMPIYNEGVSRVFASLKTMYWGLRTTPQAASFDFFILSDTNDPDTWVEEEEAWAAMRAEMPGPSGLYYRRRASNEGRKSGNIADFCRRWGAGYRYMIILDADSLLAPDTLIEMVHRMERDPGIGILQVPAVPVNGDSLFARLQQFSASLYGEIFTSGYALWTQVEGNYWGHNAILRIRPFMTCCGLPKLPGRPPLGGEIFSHDFVEAALMQRAGWKILVADDLRGSYEECPSNLVDYARRDQRWCQGNLQHIRLTFAHNLRPLSRVHFGVGVMTYLSSPLWLLFLLLAALQGVGLGVTRSRGDAQIAGHSSLSVALMLTMATVALLLLPKLWAYLLAVSRRSARRRYAGGADVLAGSVVVETLASVLIAPVLAAFRSTFVVATFLGRTVQWEAQRRGDTRISWADAFAAHAGHMIAGLAGLLLVHWQAPSLLPWMLPVLTGLTLSVPLSVLLSSVWLGRWLKKSGLLGIPEEEHVPLLLRRQRMFLAKQRSRSAGAPHPFIRAVVDPGLNALHVEMLPETPCTLSPAQLDRLQRIALSGGPKHLTREERQLLLSNGQAMRWLHREAWIDWPVDLLQKVADAVQRPAARAPQA